VSRHGARRRTSRLDISWLPNVLGHPRLGLIVPRFGRSVVARNRLRRRLREHARRALLPTLAPLDVLIRSKPDAYLAPRASIRADLDQWYAQLPR
jgi:ribonuclease P protein component